MKPEPEPKKKAGNLMEIEQQIRECEEKIATLEEFKLKEGAPKDQVERNINEQYEQMALLKIRKMMGY